MQGLRDSGVGMSGEGVSAVKFHVLLLYVCVGVIFWHVNDVTLRLQTKVGELRGVIEEQAIHVQAFDEWLAVVEQAVEEARQ